MSKLPKLVLIPADNKDIKGMGVILNTHPPIFHYAKIVAYKNEYDYANFIANLEQGTIYERIEGYNIALIYSGNLTRQLQPNKIVNKFLTQAAQFYYNSRIKESVAFYKKYVVRD